LTIREVWAWGNNYSGKLGYDNTTDKIYPVKITASFNGTGIKKVLAGCNNSFAIDKDNNVLAWGENLLDYLGVGLGNETIQECCQEYIGPEYKKRYTLLLKYKK